MIQDDEENDNSSHTRAVKIEFVLHHKYNTTIIHIDLQFCKAHVHSK